MERADTDIPDDAGGFDFSGGEEETAAEAAGGEWYGLRNTEPPVTPGEIGRELDIGAQWWEHLSCGFIKQSGGQGTEAWMHYVMAGAILVLTVTDTTGSSQASQEQSSSSEGSGPESDKETFQGPVMDG